MAIPSSSCVVKLTNSVVEKASITATDSYKLLEASHSKVNEMDIILTYDLQTSEFINSPLITLSYSNINVSTMDISDVSHAVYDMIQSDDHSSAFFGSLTWTTPQTASPTWTSKAGGSITYGNNMSYNTY